MLNQFELYETILGIELIIFSDTLGKLRENGETNDALKLVEMMSGYIVGSVDAKEYSDFLETLKEKIGHTSYCRSEETATDENVPGYLVHVMECVECGRTYEHVNGDYEFCPRCGKRHAL